MNWFHWLMLGIGALYAVVAPVILVKAILRGEKQSVFEILVNSILVAYWVIDPVVPTVTQNIHPVLRWVLPPVALLFIANMFGFAGWLFNRRRTPPI